MPEHVYSTGPIFSNFILALSTGGFTSEVEREIRASMKHIETMNLHRLISLWQQHYEDFSESGKALLPLVKLYFLAPT